MTFWAKGQQQSSTGPANGVDPLPLQPGLATQPVEGSGLPPWLEGAVKRLLASVLPQMQPLIERTETVLADAQVTLAGVRRDQLAAAAELAELRRGVDHLALVIMHLSERPEIPPGAPPMPDPMQPAEPAVEPEKKDEPEKPAERERRRDHAR
jgi:hypothetical protein